VEAGDVGRGKDEGLVKEDLEDGGVGGGDGL
jgi:hypothetical protein